MIRRFSQLEERLRNLVEESAAKIFPPIKSTSKHLSDNLAKAMVENIQIDDEGKLIAPNLYSIFLHPTLIPDPSNLTRLSNELTDSLKLTCQNGGIHFHESMQIIFMSDLNLIDGTVRVDTQFSYHDLVDTKEIFTKGNHTAEFESPESLNAFLIVNGDQTFSLDRVLTNIGRSQENHLVINNSRISRLHAQIRWIQTRYMIFDLGSTSGTYVNGQKIKKQLLNPGDVIEIGGVSLIFNQEDVVDQGYTRPMKLKK